MDYLVLSKKTKKFLGELKKLGLPPREFAVFGSGPIVVRGLREAGDLDIIVKKGLWKKLKKKYPVIHKNSCYLIQIPTKEGFVDVFDRWCKPSFDINKLIDEADVIEGTRFVRLERVLEWKKEMGRDKDERDVKLIEEYLSRE